MKRLLASGVGALCLGLCATTLAATALASAPGSPSQQDHAVVGAAAGPTVKWDWTMPAFMIDKKTWVPVNDPASKYYVKGGYFIPGPDGMPDKKLEKIKGYGAAGPARYGLIPADDRFTVKLDARKSSGAGKLRCSWHIASTPAVTRNNRNCSRRVAVRLPEGTHPLTLTVSDDRGTTVVDSKIVVKNVLIGITGDSIASGEGFPPFTKAGTGGELRTIDWDYGACHRSRWSGFVRGAQAVENADSRSNVTVVDVACSGAQITKGNIVIDGELRPGGGLLSPQQTTAADAPNALQPPQTDQLRRIVGSRPLDQLLMSIGANDIAIFSLLTSCLDTALQSGPDVNCYSAVPDWDARGRELWQIANDQLAKLEGRFRKLAPCLGSDGGRSTCKTYKVTSQGTKATKATVAKPVVLRAPGRLLETPFAPDPTSKLDPSGAVVPCQFSPNSPANQISWSWAWDVVYEGVAGQPSPLPTQYSPPLDSPDPAVITPSADGIVSQVRGNASAFGWTAVLNLVKQRNRGHGLCSADPWLYPAADATFATNPSNEAAKAHPNDKGQAAYQDIFGQRTARMNAVPVSRPRSITRNGNGLG